MHHPTHTPLRPEVPEAHRPPPRTERPTGGFRLGRLAGIDVDVEWSLLVIFAMVVLSLSTGALPRWHPEWSRSLVGIVAVVAALLFFASVFLHELSHALVGRAVGISVRRITLHVFGGVAHLEEEPPTPKAELLMAIVGPLTSLAIGVAATFGGLALVSASSAQPLDAETTAHLAGPVATLLLWLGPVNLVLGIFNLVPGFPLDGGRVLRAIVWWVTGDLIGATRWATAAGRAVGFTLMTIGGLMIFGYSVPFFGSGTIGGVWLVMIGYFLQQAARGTLERLLVKQRLAGVPVTAVMRRRPRTASPELSVAELVREEVMGSDQGTFPVLDDDQLVGVVSRAAIQVVPRDQWASMPVRRIMAPVTAASVLDVKATADDALSRLVRGEADEIPIVDGGELRGVVGLRDILKWLTLQSEPIE